MRSAKTMALLAILVFAFVSGAHGQMGNLGWVKGKEKKPADRENAPFQISFELGVGTFKSSFRSSFMDSIRYYFQDDGGIFNPGIGMNYRFSRIPLNESVKVDIALQGSVGATSDFDFSNWGIMGAIGPEIGVQLFANSRTILKPFLSFGPGILFEEHSWSDPSLIWMLRAGLELHRKGGALAFSIGAKYFSQEATYGLTKKSEKDYIGFLSLGMRI